MTRLLREEPDLDIWEIFRNYYQYFLRGTVTTVIVSLITVLFGFILGCVIALMRMSRSKLLSAFGKVGTRVLFMDDGQILEDGTPEQIF